MATVSRTWVFASDNESLVEVGDDANLAVAHDTAGNPGGSLEMLSSVSSASQSERARGPVTAGNDWTALFTGLPAGATVTDVQITGIDTNNWAGVGITAKNVQARIVDSAGASVLSADLCNLSIFGDTNGVWTAKGSQTSRTVNSGKQAAATLVALEMQVVHTGTGTGDSGIDNIAITVTYTPASSGVLPPLPTVVDTAVTRAANY